MRGSLGLAFFLSVTSLCACGSSNGSNTSQKNPGSKTTPTDGGRSADGGHDLTPIPFQAATPDDCITSVTAGHQTLMCDGLSFELNVPDVCLSKTCGFITDVHGFGMNGDIQGLHSTMRELGAANGYIVMQPSAPGAVLSSAWSPSNDSQVYSLMQRVISVFHVDPRKIHFDGYSMGAWMTWRFVCAHSDILASAAPISGGLQPDMSCPFGGDAGAIHQIPILYTHGRNDGLVNFSQAIAERDAVVAAWFPGASPTVVAEASDYEWDRYTNAAGNVFEFVQHDWACGFSLGSIALKGHCFPGSPQFLGCGRRETEGGADAGIEYPFRWADTVIQFFVNHPKT
jgi:dienelactone hydrolase